MAPRAAAWTGLDTPTGFDRCVRATVREVYGYVALLVGRDRREAERQVTEVYRSLFRAVRAGQVDSVTLGSLRSAGRRIWLDEHRRELVSIDEVRSEPASSIDQLSVLERAVVVFLHVNGMTAARAAGELGRTEREVVAVGRHAVRRLRGTDDTRGAWLRAYFGPSVSPSAGLVDRIVRDLGPRPPAEPPVMAEAPASAEPAPIVDDLPATEELAAVERSERAEGVGASLPTEELAAVEFAEDVEAVDDLVDTEEPVDLVGIEEGAASEDLAVDTAPETGVVEHDVDPADGEPIDHADAVMSVPDGAEGGSEPVEDGVEPTDVAPAEPADPVASVPDDTEGGSEPVEDESVVAPEPTVDRSSATPVGERTLAELAGGTEPAPVEPAMDDADAATGEQPAAGQAADDADVATVEQPAVGQAADDADLATTEMAVTEPARATVRSAVDDSGRTRRPPEGDLTIIDEPGVADDDPLPVDAADDRGWQRVALIALAALLAGATVVWAVARGDDEPTATPATSTSTVAVTEPAVAPVTDESVPTPSTAATTPPTTQLPTTPTEDVVLVDEISDRFEPACTGWVAGTPPTAVEVPSTFGPLGAAPAMVATLPAAVAEDDTTRPALVTTERVDAGLLLELRSGPDEDRPDTMLALVALDGTLRWIRCYDQPAAVLVHPNDDVELAVGLSVDDVRTWYRPSLADGAIDLPADPVTALALDIIGQRDGDVIAPGAVVWDDLGLFALDADGDIAWTDDEVTRVEGSPLSVATSDGIGVVAVCPGGDCSSPEVRGYDVDSGVVVWTLDGFDAVAAAGDGYGLVRHPTDGWDLVETAFGDVVDGQHWDDVAAFDPAATSRFGGVVVTVLGDTWTAWLPDGVGDGPVDVDLAPAG